MRCWNYVIPPSIKNGFPFKMSCVVLLLFSRRGKEEFCANAKQDANRRGKKNSFFIATIIMMTRLIHIITKHKACLMVPMVASWFIALSSMQGK
jgi:hypothetical protein